MIGFLIQSHVWIHDPTNVIPCSRVVVDAGVVDG